MYQHNRLKQGGCIDRSLTIKFSFDNATYTGYKGDTLASALMANGVNLVARSFKYHRPRGIYSAGSEEPNALVQLETGAHTEPNRLATEIELYDGLVATSQNCWPTLKYDIGVVNSWLSRLFPAGFYYKTFMWPASLWLTYEKYIRKAAGLGKSPTRPDPDAYDKTYAHCDVLVVGAGPSGLQAAYSAAQTGARVILADEKPQMGGQLLSEQHQINDRSSHQWLSDTLDKLQAMPEVKLLSRTTVTGFYDYNFLVANERVNEHLGANNNSRLPKERLWKIRAKQVILATGSIERPLVFADNDRPGVMLSSAIKTYVQLYAVLPAKETVLFTNNDSAYETALSILDAGGQVCIVDTRNALDSALTEQIQFRGCRILSNTTITGVNYKYGKIHGVDVMSLSKDGKSVFGERETLACSIVGVSGGWNPTVHLWSQSKGTLKYDDTLHCFLPDQCSVNNKAVAIGACSGQYSLATCLSSGHNAGMDATKSAGFKSKKIACPTTTKHAEETETALRPQWIMPCEHKIGQGRKKHFHELHNDSTIADIYLASAEGFESIEHLKRYTTTGMGTDQGKTSNLNALSAMSELRDVPIPEIGVTTFRPPFTPLTFGSIVGHDRCELFLQKRKTPMHYWHKDHGTVFENVGDWKRAYYYPQAGENMHSAVQRECLAVRKACGILDASTLGKIDLQGKGCIQLLNMLYTNAWDKLAIGRSRYGLMLNEHGMVFDDGVTTRLGEYHYHMTTTTGGAARVMNWIEEWLQTEWPEMQVYATSVTEQWAVASLNGPHARDILSQLTSLDLKDEKFPFMSMQEARVADIPARIFRISFTGELSYEINVPARFGRSLWEALMRVGEKYSLCPYGTEAMHVLRAEKGFIIVGQDTDGTATPMDLGMDWIVSKKKSDFLGRRSFTREDTARPGRKQLVGLLTDDPKFVLPEGAHAVAQIKANPPMDMLGHVTSSYMSPNAGRSIAMAMIKNGFNRKGQKIDIALMDGSSQKATVCDPVFVNTEN